ncbi:hypothetical protein [Phenylobacterium sp.]|uniref:hypothetical protein n=1 Tax=Phenylobacterium sp. TaxID=1871053 RepID=UPI00286A484B|nr:hypothetical protein [Phenylobacterium sp.]
MRSLTAATFSVLALVATAPAPAMAAAPPAGAASPLIADVRCLLTMAAFGGAKERQQAAQVGVYFFLGRISARAPGLDLGAALRAEAPKLGPQELQVELRRCGTMVEAQSTGLQAAMSTLGGKRAAGPAAPARPAAPATAATPPAPAAPSPPR